MNAKNLSLNWHTVLAIHRQTLRALLLGPGVYVILALALGIALLELRNTLGVIRSGYVTVLYEPFVAPVLGACIIAGLFMALSSALAVARERESGTLETLFYGPIRHLEYLVGKGSAHAAGYVGMLVAFLVACVMLGLITKLSLSPLVLAIMISSIAVTIALIGLGLLVAVLMRTMRGALFLFAGLILVVLALQIGEAIVTSIVTSQNLIELIVLRDMLTTLNSIVGWISPISILFRATDAAARSSWSEWLTYPLYATLYGMVALAFASELLRRKGVLR